MNPILCHFDKSKESGQSLVEMIIVLPLFFIVLSGFIFIFQQQIRAFSDEIAQSALAVTEAHFEQGERREADWGSAFEDSQKLLNKVTENALNPSSFFNRGADMKDGVFVDKKPLKREFQQNKLAQSCSLHAIYSVIAKGNGSFEFTTCAPGNAYESLDSKFIPNFVGDPQSLSGNLIYYPQPDFIWENRPFETARDALSFSFSSLGISFAKEQASLLIPDKGSFNVQCFLEPFTPSCSLHPIAGKFARAALDSSNLQITTCFAEATITCAGAGPGLPACLAGKAAVLVAALELGTQALVCPKTNKALEGAQNMIQKTVSAYSFIIVAREIAMRREILINK